MEPDPIDSLSLEKIIMPLIYTNAKQENWRYGSTDRLTHVLQKTRDYIREGKHNASAHYETWFGNQCTLTIEDVAYLISLMQETIKRRNIYIGHDTSNPYENARAYTSSTHLMKGTDVLTAWTPCAIINHSSQNDTHITISANFVNLPSLLDRTAGLGGSGSCRQSKLGTIVHEFTHLLLGTADVQLGNETMYGAYNSHKLAKGPSRVQAMRNAENWGLFVECVYRDKTLHS